jgi:hypothetical protein
VHGRSDLLQRVQRLIDQDVAARGARDHSIEVYLGDYVDRGPDSKGVLDLLIARSKKADRRLEGQSRDRHGIVPARADPL